MLSKQVVHITINIFIHQVVDLLIAMANSAAHSSRAGIILDPYPSIVDPANINKLALDPQVNITQYPHYCIQLG